MSYEAVTIETNDEARQNYEAGRCDIYTTDASGLASTRSSLQIRMIIWFFLKSFPRSHWDQLFDKVMTRGQTSLPGACCNHHC